MGVGKEYNRLSPPSSAPEPGIRRSEASKNSAPVQAPVIVTEMKANSLAKILGVPEASGPNVRKGADCVEKSAAAQ